jgi:NAD(P)-dependent dehydrogenase (short-subunit alcohol dehydrogenase family)
MRLAGKIAIIAGTGDNMGRAIPQLFAQEGARLILISRNAQALQETARLVTAAGGQAPITVQGDLTQPGAMEQALAAAQAEFGGLDILVNASGGFFEPRRDLPDTDDAFFDTAIDGLLKAMLRNCRLAAPVLAARGGGVIINLGANGSTRNRANPVYAAGKEGMIGLTRNLARRLYPQNIRVNLISPGLIWQEWQGERVTPVTGGLGRYGTGPDVAYAALYLASDEAAWVTGSELVVDGGDDALALPPVREYGPGVTKRL